MGLFGRRDKQKKQDSETAQQTEQIAQESEQGEIHQETSPQHKHDEMIEVFDEYGRKLMIKKDVWLKTVLPDQLQKHWNDPNALYMDILLAVQDGIFAEVLDAALQLKKIDPIKERCYTALSIVYMKLEDAENAEKTLDEYIKTCGKTGTILTNLAKVYAMQGREQESHATLWEGLCLEPNQENGLAWWLAIQNEEGGEEQFLKALKKACKISNSWLPQMFLAKACLEQKNYEQAKELYDQVIPYADSNPEIYFMISGDLGTNGYVHELIEFLAPVYDCEKHDIKAGLNLLQAYLQTGNCTDGQKLLNKLMQQHRPDMHDYLMRMSNEFDKLKTAQINQNSIPENPEFEMAVLNKPIWFYGLQSPEWLLPKISRSKKVGILVYSCNSIPENSEQRAQCEDDLGRLTRSLPLMISETLTYGSDLEPNVLIPIVRGVGPAVSRQEATEDFLQETAEKFNLDYVIAGNISYNGTGFNIHSMIYNKEAKTVDAAERRFDGKEFGSNILQLLTDICSKLNVNLKLAEQTYYAIPNSPVMEEYLSALGQSLIQTLIDNKIVSPDGLWGERNILDWYLNLKKMREIFALLLPKKEKC